MPVEEEYFRLQQEALAEIHEFTGNSLEYLKWGGGYGRPDANRLAGLESTIKIWSGIVPLDMFQGLLGIYVAMNRLLFSVWKHKDEHKDELGPMAFALQQLTAESKWKM